MVDTFGVCGVWDANSQLVDGGTIKLQVNKTYMMTLI